MALPPLSGSRSPFGRGTPSLGRTGIKVEWSGKKLIEAMDEETLHAFELTGRAVTRYWEDVVWTKDQHPYMTGHERDSLVVAVESTGEHTVKLTIALNMSEAYWFFEEYGDSHREGHFPLRRTVDAEVYPIAQRLRRAAAARLRSLGSAA